jgi:aspartyl-tRNA(Asn)/glutamyl-tRNA(Gln) amidotransferase subunit C
VAITEDEVKHLAKLSQLSLSGDEIARMARELEAIVGYVAQLQAVDTTGVEAMANVAGAGDAARADVPWPMLSSREVLALAPQRNEVAILVPKVVER